MGILTIAFRRNRVYNMDVNKRKEGRKTMNVKNNMSEVERGKVFSDLKIGDVYFDEMQMLTIKVSDLVDRNNTIYFDKDRQVWDTACEDMATPVFPIKATLTLEGYL